MRYMDRDEHEVRKKEMSEGDKGTQREYQNKLRTTSITTGAGEEVGRVPFPSIYRPFLALLPPCLLADHLGHLEQDEIKVFLLHDRAPFACHLVIVPAR